MAGASASATAFMTILKKRGVERAARPSVSVYNREVRGTALGVIVKRTCSASVMLSMHAERKQFHALEDCTGLFFDNEPSREKTLVNVTERGKVPGSFGKFAGVDAKDRVRTWT